MKVSINWLRQLLPGLDAPAEKIADALTSAGLEVEEVSPFGTGLDAVVVARVLGVEPHPNREKLQLVRVDHGSGEQTVVCGAPNVPPVGGLVALAKVGTHLPALGVTLDARKIGGVPSEGMLCSEAELGLAESSPGILVLPSGAEPGQSLSSVYPRASDVILTLGITPNRPDALGHVGVARDLAALLKLDFEAPAVGSFPTLSERAADVVSIDNRATERCPYYAAGVVRGVKVGPSPAWLRWRLYALGIRPISNVVDMTNYVLLEYGQPMHAFDLSLLGGNQVVVRMAEAGERFTTLDGESRELTPNDLVIGDADQATALAGVMGGENTEIRDDTQDVLLECAYFSPTGVRRSARHHALHTESSYRFERGVDWGNVPHVLERAKSLLIELAGGRAASGTAVGDGRLPELPEIALRSSRVDTLLGCSVPFDEAVAILGRLGFNVLEHDQSQARVRSASWRPDVSMEADLIEEVGRVWGLHRIPTVLPAIAPSAPRSSGVIERRVTETCVALGLSEAVSYSFVSPKALELVHAPPAQVLLDNPLSDERSVMRTSLLPGLLDVLTRAVRRGEPNLRLFAQGALFLPPVDAPRSEVGQRARPRLDHDAGVLPEERPALAILLHGDRPVYLSKPEPLDIYDMKGLLAELLERLCGHRVELELAQASKLTAHLHPRGAAHVVVEGQVIGSAGPLHPSIGDALNLSGSPIVAEIDLSNVEALDARTPKFKPIPRLPAVTRDLALELDENVPAARAEAVIRGNAGELCESVTLFDLFTGQGIAPGKRSLAFRVTYRDPKASSAPDQARTLTDKEVDEQHSRVVGAAVSELGAVQRA